MTTTIISTPIDGGAASAFKFSAADQTLIVTSNGALTSIDDTSTGTPDPTVLGRGFEGDAIVNSGIIAGYFAIGLYDQHDTITNTRGGVIEGGNNAIFMFSGNQSIINHGEIDGGPVGPDAGQSGAGIELYTANGSPDTVMNDGTITGFIGISDYIAEGTKIINSGTITGLNDAILCTDSDTTTIVNRGLIVGNVVFHDGANLFDGLAGEVDGNIVGGIGNDTFDLSSQKVTGTITGGGGSDTIAFASASAGFAIDLGDGTAYGADQAFTFSGIENATGSAYADTITGDDMANVINAGAGADTINGGGGSDTINAGPGADTVMAGPGNDVVNGNGGADILYGNGGSDTIAGGAGADTLTGGAGADTFVYSLVTDSPTSGPDLITDFTHGSDKIDLTALHLANAGDVKIASSGGLTILTIDANNDGTADMQINLTGTNVLTASDILGIPAGATPANAAATHAPAAVHHDFHAALHVASVDHGLYG